MKIVCDACQAKYSISDDKVQGKVFKIRCKKCSNIIVVRGGVGATTNLDAPVQPQVEKETRVYDYGYEGGEAPAGDDAVWHVVINQDQVGPMTAAEVTQRFGAGEIDVETYIWREGFADWLPIAQVDTFASLAAAAPAGLGSGSAGRDAVASMFGGPSEESTRSDPSDLFASSGAAASARHEDDDGGDLFGGGKAAAAEQRAAAAGGGGAGAAKMRGERNENSVLFSLNNLAQLASDKPAPAAAASSGGGGAATPGHAGGEGSGLIDIRSMASAYLGGGGAAAKPVAASTIGSIDDLPVFSGAGFSEPAVIVPTARPANNNKLMYALIGSVGLLALVAVILIFVVLKKPAAVAVATPTPAASAPPPASGDSTAPAATGSGSAAPTAVADNGSAGSATAPAAGSATTNTPPATGSGSAATTTTASAGSNAATPPPTTPPTTPPATTPTTVAVVTPQKKTTPPAPKVDKHHDQVAIATKAPDKTPTPPPPPPPPKVDSGGGCDDVSCVISNYEGACCAKFKKGAKPQAKAAGGGDLPEQLDRGIISEGVDKVRGRVMSCGDKSAAKGTVKVGVKVGGDGHVTSVTIKETPDPGLGNCVAGAMQHATFAKTQIGGSFSYPFKF